jgi:hypothetical protein
MLMLFFSISIKNDIGNLIGISFSLWMAFNNVAIPAILFFFFFYRKDIFNMFIWQRVSYPPYRKTFTDQFLKIRQNRKEKSQSSQEMLHEKEY